MQKNYSQFHKITYQGNDYIYDPYVFGKGGWIVAGKGTQGAPKNIQLQLNRLVFGKDELPSLLERYKNATQDEKEQMGQMSVSWLTLRIKGIRILDADIPDTLPTTRFEMGKVYFYLYDAKWKDKLPIWDRFPLTIPLEPRAGGFLGLNLHYLPQSARVDFIDDLVKNFGNISAKNLKFILNYSMVADRMDGYEPCIKRYLFSHIRSRIIPLERHELNYAAWMPVEEFIINKQKGKKRG